MGRKWEKLRGKWEKVRESETKLGRKQVEGREKVRVKLGKSEEKVCVEVE